MSTITTRAGKGSPLTNSEVDANFTNLNNDKLESSDLSGYTQDGTAVTFSEVQLTGGTGDQGKITWNTDEDTLDVILNGATLQVGQEIHYHVRNNTASTIANGTAVYATGTIGASGRITVAPYIANGTIPAKFFLGITTEDIATGTDGKVTHFGKIHHVDTSAFTEGAVLYPSASTAGGLTSTAPTGSNISLPVAFVIYAANNGTLFVRSTTLDENAYATAAQGGLADSALQSGDNVSTLTNDANYATAAYVDTAESDAVSTANAYTDTRETAITTAYQTYADTAVANLVDSSPSTLDTLNELAAALGDDPNFATTVSTQIGTKLDASHDMTLTLAGDASGSTTFTSMGNATLTMAVVNDSHTHDGRYYTESEADNRYLRKTISAVTATATTTLNLSEADNFKVTLGLNTAFAFSNLVAGQQGVIYLLQDATGGRTFTLPTEAKTPKGGASIVQETGANTVSILSYTVLDASNVLVNYIGDYA